MNKNRGYMLVVSIASFFFPQDLFACSEDTAETSCSRDGIRRRSRSSYQDWFSSNTGPSGHVVYAKVPGEVFDVVAYPPVYEGHTAQDEEVFSCLGVGWTLFKNGEYKKAYGPLYLAASLSKNPWAQYLVGEFYEDALGGIYKDVKKAGKYYTHVAANPNSSLYVKNKAIKGLYRLQGRKGRSEEIDLDDKLEETLALLAKLNPPKEEVLEYNRRRLSDFIKHLSQHHGYDDISVKVGKRQYLIWKLANGDYHSYKPDQNFEPLWEQLKELYPLGYQGYLQVRKERLEARKKPEADKL